MKINLKYFLFIFLCTNLFSKAQSLPVELPLVKAGAQLFNGNIYAFGLSEQNKKARLHVYKLNFQLTKTDSCVIELGKSNVEDFLLLSSDTLHDLLNIYLQKKEKKLVEIFRFNKYFKKISEIEDVDVARLNSISTFESEIFYNKQDVFTIKSVSDTSGKQFYLNKYRLKSELKNFEYDPKWQFPFERKNINSAHIIFANNLYVLLFVNVIDGQKRGQWLLKINNLSGQLTRGTKINDKGDNSFFTFGKIIIDSVNSRIFLQGQKFTAAEFDQKENKINVSGKTALTIYLAAIDTAGELLSRNEFKVPVTEAKGIVNKMPVNYILRTNAFTLNKEGSFLIETAVFKSVNNQLCYNYCNSTVLKISQQEDKLLLEKNSVGTNLQIEKFYVTNDKLDMNGKICTDSLKNFEKLFYAPLTFNVNIGYKTDETNNPVWLLKKTEIKKNTENYSILGPVKKVYQITKVTDVNKSENPACFLISPKQFIISKQSLPDRFQLQLFNW